MEGRNFERRENHNEFQEAISFLEKKRDLIVAIFGNDRSTYVERFLGKDLFVPKKESIDKARRSNRINEDEHRRLLKICGMVVDMRGWEAEHERAVNKGDRGKPVNHEMEMKVENLRNHIALIVGKVITGKPGSNLIQLFKLLQNEPQVEDGNIRYLVTSGCAVELITGFKRSHHDLDLVILDNPNADKWEIYGTDNVTAQKYWADMVFDPEFLANTAISLKIDSSDLNKTFEILVVHPAILLVQKMSNAFGRLPRDKDWADAKALVKFWGSEGADDWEPLIISALNALPDDQVKMTKERLISLF